jgi:ankyrin repeat protein
MDTLSWPVHAAAAAGDAVALQRAIRDRTAHLRLPNRDGWTPLHFAAQSGHLGCLRQLLPAPAQGLSFDERIAVLDARNRRGWTALHIAASAGHVLATRELIEVRLLVSVLAWRLPHQRRVQHVAVSHAISHSHTRGDVRLQLGANIALRNSDGATPAHLAAEQGFLDVVRLLVAAGADPFAALDAAGRSVVDCALQRGHARLAAELQRAAAAPRVHHTSTEAARSEALFGTRIAPVPSGPLTVDRDRHITEPWHTANDPLAAAHVAQRQSASSSLVVPLDRPSTALAHSQHSEQYPERVVTRIQETVPGAHGYPVQVTHEVTMHVPPPVVHSLSASTSASSSAWSPASSFGQHSWSQPARDGTARNASSRSRNPGLGPAASLSASSANSGGGIVVRVDLVADKTAKSAAARMSAFDVRWAAKQRIEQLVTDSSQFTLGASLARVDALTPTMLSGDYTHLVVLYRGDDAQSIADDLAVHFRNWRAFSPTHRRVASATAAPMTLNRPSATDTAFLFVAFARR